MKIANNLMLVFMLGLALAGCKSKAEEKRIAELESRLAQLESKNNTAIPSATPVPSTTPTAATDTKPDGPTPTMDFSTTDHDFGTVQEGDKVSYTYALKNNGQAPLMIQSAQPSCGCTVPEWTRTPIPVGGTGFVKAEFDTKGKVGINNKTITVTANTWPKTTTLKFKAMVAAKPDGANGPVK